MGKKSKKDIVVRLPESLSPEQAIRMIWSSPPIPKKKKPIPKKKPASNTGK